MIVLGFDTCLAVCSVAVCDGARVLGHAREEMARGHQERLAPMTREVMADAGSIFIGDPDSVYAGIKNMYADVGGFGVLLLMAGWRDKGSRAQRFRGLRMFMEEVAPRLAGLNPDADSKSQGVAPSPAALNR